MSNPPKVIKVAERTSTRTEFARVRMKVKGESVFVEGYVSTKPVSELDAIKELAENSRGLFKVETKKCEMSDGKGGKTKREYGKNWEVRLGDGGKEGGSDVLSIHEDGKGGAQAYEKGGLAAVVNGDQIAFLGLDQIKFRSGMDIEVQYDPYMVDVEVRASSVTNLLKYGKKDIAGFHNGTVISEESIRELNGRMFSEFFAISSDAIAANNLILSKDSFASFNVADVFVSANLQLLRTAYEFGRGQDSEVSCQPFSQLGLPSMLCKEIAGEVERKNNYHRDYWERKRERANLRIARGLGIAFMPAAAGQGMHIFDIGATVIPLIAKSSIPKRALAELRPAKTQHGKQSGKTETKGWGAEKIRMEPDAAGAAAATRRIPQAGERQETRGAQTPNARKATAGERNERTERSKPAARETKISKPKPLLDEKPASKAHEHKNTGTERNNGNGMRPTPRPKLHAPKKETKKDENGNAEPYKRKTLGEKPAGKHDAKGTKKKNGGGGLNSQNHNSKERPETKDSTGKRTKKPPGGDAHAPSPAAANARPKKARRGSAEAPQEKPVVKERSAKAKKTADKATARERKSQTPEGKTKELVRSLAGNLAKKADKRSEKDGTEQHPKPEAGKKTQKNKGNMKAPAALAPEKAEHTNSEKNVGARPKSKAAADKEKKAGSKGFLGGNVPTGKKPEPLTYGLRVRRSGQAELRAPDDKTTDLPKTDKRSKTILTERNKKGGAGGLRTQQKDRATSAFQSNARIPVQNPAAPAKAAPALPPAAQREAKRAGFGLVSPFAVLKKANPPTEAAKVAVEAKERSKGKKKKAAKTRREIARAPSSSSSARPRAIRPAA